MRYVRPSRPIPWNCPNCAAAASYCFDHPYEIGLHYCDACGHVWDEGTRRLGDGATLSREAFERKLADLRKAHRAKTGAADNA